MIIKEKKLIEKIYFPLAITREKIARGAKLLDIGCASGYFLGCCDQGGMETYGIELSDDLLRQAKQGTKARLFKHDINSGLGLFESGSFDCVTAFDVIEHLDSPQLFLNECRRILKTGGKLVITTPNLAAIARSFLKDKWYGFSDNTHKYFFTPKTLSILFIEAGFIVKRLEAPFHPLPKLIQLVVNRLGIGGQIWIVGEK
jgi:2-polyprenyl-3-methyl-5-hydroxy-6-metoxy-1,4-benzoquinol methylase